MTRDSDNDRVAGAWDTGLAFFGAITASVSHELNNVLAIVDQTGGLLLDVAGVEPTIASDRVTAAADVVRRQTERALEIVRRLNQFAHSADDGFVEFDAVEVLDNLIALCQRLAEMKRGRLVFATTSDRLTLVGNPFFFQTAVFSAFRSALATVQRDDEIVVSLEKRDAGVTVSLECPRIIDTNHADMLALQKVAGHMHVQVSMKNRGEGTVVDITASGDASE